MARTVAIGMQKGGVGKTTTAINLAMGLVLADQRVLLVDVDPQGNATSGLGLEVGPGGLYGALLEEFPLEDALQPARGDWLHLVPPGEELNAARARLPQANSRHQELAEVIRPAQDRYDWILLDCPPSLGPLTLNALNAADQLLVTLQSEYYALEGLGQLWSTYRSVQQRLNPALELLGILITMHDERTNLATEVREDVQDHFKDKVFETIIPRNVRVGEAPGHGESVIEYAPTSRGSRAYLAFVQEVLHRVGRTSGSRTRPPVAGGS